MELTTDQAKDILLHQAAGWMWAVVTDKGYGTSRRRAALGWLQNYGQLYTEETHITPEALERWKQELYGVSA